MNKEIQMESFGGATGMVLTLIGKPEVVEQKATQLVNHGAAGYSEVYLPMAGGTRFPVVTDLERLTKGLRSIVASSPNFHARTKGLSRKAYLAYMDCQVEKQLAKITKVEPPKRDKKYSNHSFSEDGKIGDSVEDSNVYGEIFG